MRLRKVKKERVRNLLSDDVPRDGSKDTDAEEERPHWVPSLTINLVVDTRCAPLLGGFVGLLTRCCGCSAFEVGNIPEPLNSMIERDSLHADRYLPILYINEVRLVACSIVCAR